MEETSESSSTRTPMVVIGKASYRPMLTSHKVPTPNGFKRRPIDKDPLPDIAVDPTDEHALAKARNTVAKRESRKRKLEHVTELETLNQILKSKLQKYKNALPALPASHPSEGESGKRATNAS
jgi:hypothetical protein